MKLTKLVKSVGVLALAALMMLTMAACGGGNKEEEKWEQDVTVIMEDITTSQTAFNTALANIQPGDEASQTAILDAIATLEDDFARLKEVEAPEKYKDVQVKFNTAADKALEGTAAFREMANNLGDGGDMTVVSEKLSAGQTAYEAFLTLWQEALDDLTALVTA
ncbi:hypothetical protein [Clostridium sp. D33t1_170424_F3]|uniref:hypothetical protein n=1 Tax=Clostridium sp. D33t1_170424_F3 TaxID=2787099 RepID=UPI0018A914DF|nr:hypothetical protein [Clostridium sp. D33t1_170424_F3]